jgi:hypothetical protein
LTPDDKQLAKALSDDAIFIGDRVEYPPLVVGEKSFHFDAFQIRFLAALEQYRGDLVMACNAVGKDLDWANAFLSCRKFNAFKKKKLALSAARNGSLADFWWSEVLDGAKGYKEWYDGPCELCHEPNVFSVAEAEMVRQDDMSFKAACKVCVQPVALIYHREKYSPTREQVQCLQMIGDRKVPKIERVHHEFSTETYSFPCEESFPDPAPEAA